MCLWQLHEITFFNFTLFLWEVSAQLTLAILIIKNLGTIDIICYVYWKGDKPSESTSLQTDSWLSIRVINNLQTWRFNPSRTVRGESQVNADRLLDRYRLTLIDISLSQRCFLSIKVVHDRINNRFIGLFQFPSNKVKPVRWHLRIY